MDSKIAYIYRTDDSEKDELGFDYDAMGNRIAKHIYTAEGVYKKSTYYVRDASGNVMATYSAEVNTQEATETYKLIERPIYGSSRVGLDVTEVEWIVATDGMGQPIVEVAPPVTANNYTRELGHKQYEMSNHLGNVLVVVNDIKMTVFSSNTITGYRAQVISATDYSPFSAALSICGSEWLAMRTLSERVNGVAVPLVYTQNIDPRVDVGVGLEGRTYTSESGYRYGFNGKEKDSENFEGAYDFGARIMDTRLGRWLSMDLMTAEAPSWTAYRYGFNNTIRISDPNGKFEIDEATAAAYPKLNSYLRNVSSIYAGKPAEFKKAFKQYSEMSDQQINDMLEYKLVKNGTPVVINQKCPRIVVEDLQKRPQSANGVTPIATVSGPGRTVEVVALGTISLDKELVDFYEHNYADPLKIADNNPIHVASVAAELLLESTLFHEGTHYGDAINGLFSQSDLPNEGPKEGGKNFEKTVYGQDIGSSGPPKVEKVNGHYIEVPTSRFQAVMDYVKACDYKGAATRDEKASKK